jgi:hypothetical protein
MKQIARYGWENRVKISNQWFTDCIKLLESNNIGWAWWTLKKLRETIVLMYVNKPPI